MQVKLILDTRKVKSSGLFPLKLYISYYSNTLYYNTGTDLTIEQWQPEINKVIMHEDASIINKVLQVKLARVKNLLYKLDLQGELETINNEQLKLRIKHNTTDFVHNDCDFEQLLYEFIKNKAPKTKSTYIYTLDLCNKYSNNTLRLSHINFKWLKELEDYMQNKLQLKTNTRSIHFRNIRAVYNYAIQTERVTPTKYPFKSFKIRSEKTPKRNMSVEMISKLANYPCKKWQEKYIDMFMLMFYFIGINSIDLWNLTHSNVDDERLHYKRSKTKKWYNIKILPEAQSILNKYQGTNKLIKICENYANHEDFRKKINLVIQNIAPEFDKITTYSTRHTWATIAASLDVPKETIAAALGHSQNSVTDIYINFDNSKIDKANLLVCNYLKNYKHEKN